MQKPVHPSPRYNKIYYFITFTIAAPSMLVRKHFSLCNKLLRETLRKNVYGQHTPGRLCVKTGFGASPSSPSNPHPAIIKFIILFLSPSPRQGIVPVTFFIILIIFNEKELRKNVYGIIPPGRLYGENGVRGTPE